MKLAVIAWVQWQHSLVRTFYIFVWFKIWLAYILRASRASKGSQRGEEMDMAIIPPNPSELTDKE